MKPENEQPRSRRTSNQMWIPGRPIPYARTRGGSRRYQEPRYAAWRELAAEHLAIQRGPTIDGPVTVRITVSTRGIRAGFAPVDQNAKKGLRGDLDNYVKAVLDAATDADVIGDDRTVQAITATFIRPQHHHD